MTKLTKEAPSQIPLDQAAPQSAALIPGEPGQPTVNGKPEPTTLATIRQEFSNLPPLAGIGVDILTLGRILFQSGYFQDVRQVSQAVVKVLAGQELGIGPIRSMTEFHIVSNKIVMGASLMASMIKRSKRYDFRIRRIDHEACELTFYEGVQEIGESVFTLEDAKRAGLLQKGGAWVTYPRNMLFARALSNGAKWHCAGVFGGAVYSPDEDFEEMPQPAPRPVDTTATPSGDAAEAAVTKSELVTQRLKDAQATMAETLPRGDVPV